MLESLPPVQNPFSEHDAGLPKWISMYEISGQDPITEHAYHRSLLQKERQTEAIVAAYEHSPAFHIQQIEDARGSHKTDLIRQGLESGDSEIRGDCVRMIMSDHAGLGSQLSRWIETALNGQDAQTQKLYVEMMPYAATKTVPKLIQMGLAVLKSRDSTADFRYQLKSDKRRIRAVLHKRKTKHGHFHDYNFCLRFFRDAEGGVDFKKKPRLYLIDFDQAVSPNRTDT